MSSFESLLRIDGLVDQPLTLGFRDLERLDARVQVSDLKRWGLKRPGDAVRLVAVLALARPRAAATYLGLHASRDNFHASIPLEGVVEQALLIYRLAGEPLSTAVGGPFRLYIPDHAACRVAEIDECANVKYLDRIELTAGKGFDNRPHDEAEHARLHQH